MNELKTVEVSQKVFNILLAVVVVGAVFLAGELWYQFSSLPSNAPHEVQVTGQGKTYAKPDVAIVDLGVHSQAAKSQDAVNQNNKTMNAVIAAVKGAGVEDKDIQTTMYNLAPLYNYNQPKPVGGMIPSLPGSNLVGYTLDQQVEIKIRDFNKINDILDKATAAGTNTVGSLQFTIDNPEKVQEGARQQAITQAKEKAQALFAEAGLRQGKLVSISENSSPVPQPLYGMGAAASIQSAPQIQTGQLEIDSNVTLTYQAY